jgi:hypothetical protein
MIIIIVADLITAPQDLENIAAPLIPRGARLNVFDASKFSTRTPKKTPKKRVRRGQSRKDGVMGEESGDSGYSMTSSPLAKKSRVATRESRTLSKE